MLVVQEIKENKALFIAGLQKRNFSKPSLLDDAIEADNLRKSTQLELDTILAESNQISKQVGELFKQGKTEQANQAKQKTTELKEQINQLKTKLNSCVEQLQQILYQIPNIPHESVVAGTSEQDNEVVFTQGTATQKQDNKPHWDIAKDLNIVDFETGVKVTGAGFPFYKGKGAKLQRALVQYFLDQNVTAGYEELNPPLLINESSGYGTGQLPDKEGQMYEIANNVSADTLYLIPTSEVPVTNVYRDVLLTEAELPIKHTAYSPCFRREAGSYGKEVRGLNRLHQFEKVEIVRIEHPNQSYTALNQMVEHIKQLLQDLELPYRILRLCGGDTGFTSALTYDFEVWSAAQGRWLEVSSVSNFQSYQANRLKLRFKNNQGTQLCHTLNGSALALPRVMAALLENHQTNEGKIIIPQKLRAYTGFDSIEL